MARQYRRVTEAVAKLRRAAGALAAVNPADSTSAWVAVGALQVWVLDALDLLQADDSVAPTQDFVDGYDAMATLFDALPFPEA